MIPLLLHQTWKATALPEPLRTYCETWKRHNPALGYRFYDDQACCELVRNAFPQYLKLYESLPFAIQRADLFRYLAIYRFGGLYADIDMECLRRIDHFLIAKGALFSIEARLTRVRQRELGYRHPFQIANCIFAAEAGHPFLLHLIEQIAAMAVSRPACSLDDVEDTTGPRLLTRLIYQWPNGDLPVLEPIYWMPPTLYPNVWPLSHNMFARHHFRGTWKDSTGQPRSLQRRLTERYALPNPFPRTLLHTFRRD